MKTINTIFAVHNHQPSGNFEKVLEDAYQKSYKPFLDVLSRHPSLKITQHWTGTLLSWVVKSHPELIETMKEMIGRGQLELMTGAYYEAILSVIPERDRVGQIRKLTDYIGEVFDYAPRGLWLAERVWEQSIVGSLATAEVEYVMVDDTHLRHAGLTDEGLPGYYITEDHGQTVKVFPIDKTLRYTIPFRPVEETIRYLQRMASADGLRTIVSADDGEKFGVWPKTFAHVYDEGWLEEFCSVMEENQTWIRSIHPSEVIDSSPPMGLIYLPSASYSEMMKWALPATSFVQLERFEQSLKDAKLYEENAAFVRGGYWRNFLARYPESNHMHKRMLRVATRAHQAVENGTIDRAVLDHVWAAQCNDPYWHGVFGGIYLPNLRYAVYKNLIQAERMLDTIDLEGRPRIKNIDFDCDGQDELIVEMQDMNVYLKPEIGGMMAELDFKPTATNLLDIVSRREEGSHRRLMSTIQGKEPAGFHEGFRQKEEGLEKYLHFDWYRHGSFIDHFFGEGTTIDMVASARYLEMGDFVNRPYAVSVVAQGNSVTVALERHGALWFGNTPHRIYIQKQMTFEAESGSITVVYLIRNEEKRPVRCWFGVEVCVALLAGDASDRYYEIPGRRLPDKRLGSTGEEKNISEVKLVDEWQKIETGITLSNPANLWRFPLETVSLSEDGFERVFQGSILVPNWKISLKDEFTCTITQNIRQR